ncbi:MAG: aminotransferase [Gammaproteobacteria bacterium]|nr:aminotransferase [Gammaproteobacteria bacterium]
MTQQAEQLRRRDAAHHLHPFTDFADLAKKGTRLVVRGQGVYIFEHSGHKLLDGMSGLWNVNMGYGQPSLINAAREQLETLPFYNSFFQCTTPPSVHLAEQLSEISGLSHVFFTNGGSDANDTQLRLVKRFWQLQGKPEKRIVIGRENAYHGSTLASASLGGMKPMHTQGDLPIPDIVHVDQPYYFGAQTNESPEAFAQSLANQLDERIKVLGPSNVAAFIGEPVQGAGGVIIPPENYWPAIEAVCRRHDVLLIADEVITGFGRLGEWFAFQRMGFKPDLVTFAKGVTSGYIPLGGVLVGDRVAKTLTSDGGEFAHGFTNSGHPVACAVGLANLKLMHDTNVLAHVREEAEPYLRALMAELASKHEIIAEARLLGLMGAFELGTPDSPKTLGETCRDLATKAGLVMRATGNTMIIAPPLVISKSEIDELIEKADHAFRGLA